MAFEKLNINLKATPVLQELIQDLENNTSIIPVVGTDRLIIQNF